MPCRQARHFYYERMKKKTLFHALCAIVVTFWSVGAGAAAVPSLFEKQFARLDSSLTRIAGLPEVRMKEVAPFDGMAKQVLAAHPEIAALIRTNSKGIVVNCARSAYGESLLHADVSGREWYAEAKSRMNAYRGPLQKENGRTRRILSRPLSIISAAGESRFGGVVAMFLDIREKQAADGAARIKKGPGPPEPSMQLPAGPAKNDKQELLPYGDTAVTPRPQSARSETSFLRVAGTIAVLLVAFCLWLIISTLRKRQPLQQSSGPADRQQPPFKPAVFVPPVVETGALESVPAEEPVADHGADGPVLDEIAAGMRAKITDEKRDEIYADYDRLMEHLEQLSASLKNIEALQSLSQTITMLTDEKKKYKYLNLNTAQTESLLEYLTRVHNRLNIFFDKVDESVRVLMLNLSSVKNKLNDNE
jgi:hypothetical protein